MIQLIVINFLTLGYKNDIFPGTDWFIGKC